MKAHGMKMMSVAASSQKRKENVPRSFLHSCMTEWAKTYLQAELRTPYMSGARGGAVRCALCLRARGTHPRY
jgi:hypothetical protein